VIVTRLQNSCWGDLRAMQLLLLLFFASRPLPNIFSTRRVESGIEEEKGRCLEGKTKAKLVLKRDLGEEVWSEQQV